jgi:biotin transporter BioY
VIFCLTRADLRQPLWNVIVAFCRPVLLGSLAALAAYVAGVVWLVSQTGLWQDDLFTATLVWFITAGFALWANAKHVTEQRHFVPRTLTQTVALTVFIEGLVHLYVSRCRSS